MLAVLSVVVACLTVLSVEGSLVFYRHPMAPRWLKANTSLQVTISCVLSMGAIGAVFLLGQFLVGSGSSLPNTAEVGAMAVVLVVSAFLLRWIRGVGRSLSGTGPDTIGANDDSIAASPSRRRASGRRKAA